MDRAHPPCLHGPWRGQGQRECGRGSESSGSGIRLRFAAQLCHLQAEPYSVTISSSDGIVVSVEIMPAKCSGEGLA